MWQDTLPHLLHQLKVITKMERFIDGYVYLTPEEMTSKSITTDAFTQGDWVVGADDLYWFNPTCDTVSRLTAQGVQFQ